MRNGDVLHEKSHVLAVQETTPGKPEEEWMKYGLFILWGSVILTTFLGVLSFVLYCNSDSPTALAFVVDAMLDTLSSCLVIWRMRSQKADAQSREMRTCVLLAVLFMASALCIGARSAWILASLHPPKRTPFLYLEELGATNAGVCSAIAICKFHAAHRLGVRSFFADGVNSAIGACMGVSMWVSNWVYSADKKVWYLDSCAGLLLATIMLLYGLWLLQEVVRSKTH